MKTGIVDVGGGLRGIYAAGVLDLCMDRGIKFDLGIGVSAGSANLISYAAGQRWRNYRFYTDYSFRPEYMGMRDFVRSGSYINMDYMYSALSNSGGEDPLDFPAVLANPMELFVVASDAETGEARYFTKADLSQDNYDILKASSSIPFVCPPYPVQGRLYYDGALGDPVPVEKAFELGCDRVVVLLTKPEAVPRRSGTDIKFAAGIQRKYPAAAHALRLRASRYNAGVFAAQRFALEGRAIIISPDDTCGVNTLTRDREALDKLYQKGLADGEKVAAFLSTQQKQV